MRHRRRVQHFDRDTGARKALIRGLVDAVVEHGRITTTVERAKEVRRHVEKAVTFSKKGTVAARRILTSRYPNAMTVKTLVDDLGVRFKDRPGGYTRVIKIGRRPGDTAEMAFLEFVDYDYEKAEAAKEQIRSNESLRIELRKKAEKQKKRLRKLQVASRRIARKNA